MKSRRGFAIQRLMNALRQAHEDGWFIVFDTLTSADDRLEAAYDNANSISAYLCDNCRLHFHAVHFMRTLPTGSVDPNFGRRVRNRRQLNSLQNTWPYGYSMPIA